MLISGNYTNTNIVVNQKAITIQAEITGGANFQPPAPPSDSPLKPYDYVFLFANSTSTMRGILIQQSATTAVKVLGVAESKVIFDSCAFLYVRQLASFPSLIRFKL
jgi:hypothetical protein